VKSQKRSSRICICCYEPIRKIYDNERDDADDVNCNWDGCVDRITAGYGSSHDGEVFVFAICDQCIETKARSGVIEFIGDYLFHEKPEDRPEYPFPTVTS